MNMKVNPKYLIYHDLIGIEALIKPKSKAKDAAFREIGEIIDDTQNLIIAKNRGTKKKYVKKDNVFQFKLSNNEVLQVNGTKILGRPENRLRALRKKRWIK